MVVVLLASCSDVYNSDTVNGNGGEFVASVASEYSLDMSTRTSQSVSVYKSKSSNAAMTVEESDWTDDNDMPTRGNILGDEVTWPEGALISMFITDIDNNILTRDTPLSGKDLTVYNKYDINKEGTPTAITGSSFFWDSWANKDKLNGRTVNFYGYYPRPCDATNWEYVRNSVVEVVDARKTTDDWNTFSYSFYEDQSDANLSFFDLMYSMPEVGGISCENRHGNKNKTADSNIQMAFRHAFCLLDIEVRRSDKYVGNCNISGLTVSGSQVFSGGTIDIKMGTTTPRGGNYTIKRKFDAQDITLSKPFHTTLITQPTTDDPNAMSTADNERFVVSCDIDGATYTCPLPKIKLEAGKKYKLTLTVTPSGAVVFRVWNGATVTVGNTTISAGENETTLKANNFSVASENGYKVLRVLRNGVEQKVSTDGKYTLESSEGANTYYDIVTCPETGWYTAVEKARTIFDAKWNDKYGDAQKQSTNITYWSDLTGEGNNGSLLSFDGTSGSGWTGTGLAFDGVDDIVRFPGNISSGDFTVEMYIKIDASQVSGKVYGRLLAEDEKTGFPSMCLCSNDGNVADHRISVCGNGKVDHNLTNPYETKIMGKLCQVDYVFKAKEQGGGTVYIYVNGVNTSYTNVPNTSKSISEASIGNRIKDNTRALKATYHSFIIYDKALSEDEMKENLEINESRFGQSDWKPYWE